MSGKKQQIPRVGFAISEEAAPAVLIHIVPAREHIAITARTADR